MTRSILEAVFNTAAIYPNKLCLADEKGSVTYAGYATKVRKFAKILTDLGVEAGDKVVVEASQEINFLALHLSLQALGAVFVPLENNCGEIKLNKISSRTGAKLIVSSCGMVESSHNNTTLVQLTEKEAHVSGDFEIKFPSAQAESEILFSTGTTGKEKGIVITHNNNIALAENVISGVGMEHDNVELILSPMNHSHGLRRYYANMVCGASVVVLSIMNLSSLFQYMENYRVTSMDLVPSALSIILKETGDKLGDYKDRLRYIQLGSAPIPEEYQNMLCRLLPDTRLYNFYGSTESGCIAIYDFNNERRKKSCIGKPTIHAEIFLMDKNIRITSPHKVGQLACRGPMNMKEYFEDQDETRKVKHDDFIRISDEAFYDDDGEIILLGRCGDVISVGGKKVAPEEIEDAARSMPGVTDCACVPMPDKILGSVPKLYVQLQPGEEFNPISIKAWMRKRLESYKLPVKIELIDSIPKTYNGKTLRNELMKSHEEGFIK